MNFGIMIVADNDSIMCNNRVENRGAGLISISAIKSKTPNSKFDDINRSLNCITPHTSRVFKKLPHEIRLLLLLHDF